jgi:hypothetical protein
MCKAGTVAGLTSAQSLLQDIQKDVNKEGIADHKERNNTTWSSWKLNIAHHRVIPLVEIQILHFLLLFFDIFLILYHLNRKHIIFSSIGQTMWPIEIPQFLAQNLNHHPGSELGALEVDFGPLPVGKPD